MAAFVRPRYEYAINEDARRAQLAADVAAAELEKPCRRDARRAAADAAALAAQQDAFLRGVGERPAFASSLDTMEAPLDPLRQFGGRPPPPDKPVAPHPPPDIREEVPLSTTEAARLRINRALARVMRKNLPTQLRLHSRRRGGGGGVGDAAAARGVAGAARGEARGDVQCFICEEARRFPKRRGAPRPEGNPSW